MITRATAGNRARQVAVAALRGLWSARTWRATSHVVTGMALGLPGLLIMLALLAATLLLSPTVVGAALVLGLLRLAIRAFTWLQRSRFAGFLALELPQPPAVDPTAPVAGKLLRDLRDTRTWRQLGYHLFAGVSGVLGGTTVIACWSAGLTLTPAVLYGRAVYGTDFSGSVLLTVAALYCCSPRRGWPARRP